MNLNHIGDRVWVYRYNYSGESGPVKEKFYEGFFLGFGVEWEEIDSGQAVQYTTAIIEDFEGAVHTTAADMIQFI